MRVTVFCTLDSVLKCTFIISCWYQNNCNLTLLFIFWYTFYCLIKTPGLIITPPFLSENFQILKTCLIITPPLAQKILLLIILVLFSCFSLGRKPDDIPLLQRIRDYNCRCSSHADDPLVFFDNFVERQSIRSGELRRNTLRIPVGVGRTFKSGMDMTNWYDMSTRNWYFISIVQLFTFVI